ncbi:MAG: hypothetical protein HQK89_16715 [Nitrospirae bacterium]|nr:hypothetical protein [Nitrospirota bacterium]
MSTTEDLKATMKELFGQFVVTIKAELDKKPDKDEVVAIVRKELSDYPRKDEVPTKAEIRQIVREEIDKAFSVDTFHLTRVK